ncbi:MAG: glycosyltransferase [Leptospiraceae bacterium]|nr:glycosyltransferase [Leptospiraceae bacterium]
MPDVSLILPTYNESGNIKKVLDSLLKVLDNSGYSFELIVVDDNSPDGTAAIVREIESIDPRIRLLVRYHNRGLSHSVLAGFEFARGKVLGVMDADLQHDETILVKMLSHLEEYDLVIGSRFLSDSMNDGLPHYRLLMSKTAIHLIQYILGLKLNDPLSGYFVLKRSYYEKVSEKINPRGFKILLELISRNPYCKYLELPFRFRKREDGSTKLNHEVILDFLLQIIEIRLGILLSPRFIRYSIIGFSGIPVNLLGQTIGHFLFDVKYIFISGDFQFPGLSVILGYVLSFLNNFLWNNFWTFKDVQFKSMKEYSIGLFRYLLITFLGFIIQISVWRLFWELYELSSIGENYSFLSYFFNFIGILFATTWNYILSKKYAWRILS